MRRAPLAIFLSLGLLVTGLSACRRSPPVDPCERLVSRLCGEHDWGYCRRVEAYLGRELRGPQGRRLPPAARRRGCRLILEDARVLGAYQRQAARKIQVTSR